MIQYAREFTQLTMLTLTILLISGCGSFGPRTIDTDQLNYGHSVGDAWKNQMLANIVRMRFYDMPVFLDVGQIVSGYTLETTVNGSVGFNTSFTGDNTQGLGVSGKYIDRPTITYSPKTGDDYLRSLLEPVRPSALMALILAGYNAELLFTWGVEAINGVRNYSVTRKSATGASPDFVKFVELLSKLQAAGAVGFELETDPETDADMIFFFYDDESDAQLTKMKTKLREIIDLPEDQHEFRVLYSPFAVDDETLAIQTRSILQMLTAMAGFVDVPADKAARASRGFDVRAGAARPFQVNTSTERPEDAFASFKYNGDWYWIDHEDILAKRAFTLMLFITTLTNQPENMNAPVLTIPTG